MDKNYEDMTLEKLRSEKQAVEGQIRTLRATQGEIAAAIEIKHTEEKVGAMNDKQRDSLRQVLGKG